MNAQEFVEDLNRAFGPKGPTSFRIWQEKDGTAGMEWHCPEDGCGQNKIKGTYPFCPHRKKTTRQGKLNWLCTNDKLCLDALETWGISSCIGFIKLFQERA